MDDRSKMFDQTDSSTTNTGASTVASAGTPGSPDAAATISSLGPALQSAGGIDGLMQKLRGAGLGGQVDSWVASGPNEPVDPGTLGEALGPETTARMSSETGLDIKQLLPLLAAVLPQLINMLTPNGRVPEGGLDQAAGSQPDIGGILGGLLGGSGTGGAGGSGLDDVLGGLGGMLGGKRG